ncbi:YmaF family protein [Paenibacillus validus]|uniref:YmaF family protein n=1 Tax=Paenibacillus validus TaxID=44253 RepID=A0A7X3CR80_9BACL|nr:MULTISPECIES: YmaF family protein [Paenibacillus]MED4604069.1 YmaF family protein [Paenibacillus validus]MED4605428.1 YmaF family protein [Paenibacillus validus]MUG70435.1 hypothetical protein [Paenibacillus validus]
MRKFQELPGATAPRPLAHAHYAGGWTDTVLGHAHSLELFTYPVNGSAADGHVHTFQGHTHMSAGHFHRFFGSTGPAIALPSGEHIHRVEFSLDDEPFEPKGNFYKTVLSVKRHVHHFAAASGPEIGHDLGTWDE